MSYVLKLALKQSLPSETLYAMNAKLARRVLKLGSDIDNVNEKALCYVQETMREANDIVSKRWASIQKDNSKTLDLSRLANLDFESDSRVNLPALDQYIDSISSRQTKTRPGNFTPSSGLTKFVSDCLPALPSSVFYDDTYAIANLQGFEEWVSAYSRQW